MSDALTEMKLDETGARIIEKCNDVPSYMCTMKQYARRVMKKSQVFFKVSILEEAMREKVRKMSGIDEFQCVVDEISQALDPLLHPAGVFEMR